MPKKGKPITQSVKYETDKESTRYWVTLFYPEGAKTNWLQELESWGVEASISPLHDQDKRDDGTLKKPHHHIILCFGGNKTGLQVRLMMQTLLTEGHESPMVQKAKSVEGAEKYQNHSEEDEKVHYNEEPKHINGFDINKYQKTTQKRTQEEREEEENNSFYEIMEIIETENITEIYRLAKYIQENRRDLTTFLRKRTILINSIITSRRNEKKSVMDEETIEVIRERNALEREQINAIKNASFTPW